MSRIKFMCHSKIYIPVNISEICKITRGFTIAFYSTY